jgi:hypothetical protein
MTLETRGGTVVGGHHGPITARRHRNSAGDRRRKGRRIQSGNGPIWRPLFCCSLLGFRSTAALPLGRFAAVCVDCQRCPARDRQIWGSLDVEPRPTHRSNRSDMAGIPYGSRRPQGDKGGVASNSDRPGCECHDDPLLPGQSVANHSDKVEKKCRLLSQVVIFAEGADVAAGREMLINAWSVSSL